jgi:hypothetical protein
MELILYTPVCCHGIRRNNLATSLVFFPLSNFITVTTENLQQYLTNSIFNFCNQLNRLTVISLFEIMILNTSYTDVNDSP